MNAIVRFLSCVGPIRIKSALQIAQTLCSGFCHGIDGSITILVLDILVGSLTAVVRIME